MDTLGKRLKARREQLGLSQLDLATRAEVKQNTLSDLESEKSKSINGLNLTKLCRELRVTAEYLMFGGDPSLDHELAVAEAEAVYIIRMLGADQREIMLRMARSLLMPSQPLLVWNGSEVVSAPQQKPRH